MRPLLALAAVALVAGCVDPMGVDPSTSVAMMKGDGSVHTAPDGKKTFHFVVPANAYRGVIDDPAELRKQHEYLIGQWASGRCDKGYSITEVRNVSGMTSYTGPCR